MISPTYPGVYVEEIDTFPASVAAVATAIPAFLGYVQRAERAGRSLLRTEAGTVTIEPVRIGSLLEFEEVFGGGAAAASVNVALDATNQVKSVDVTPSFYLHASMRGFFDNGGGNCWIVPIGLYGDTRGGTPDAAHFTEGLDAIAKVDEPTLLVAPDAMLLASPGDVHQAMLAQSAKLKDRFAILDVPHDKDVTRLDDDDITAFRDGTGTAGLRYGAAYYPHLRTSYPLSAGLAAIKLTQGGANIEFNTLAPASLAGIYGEAQKVKEDLDGAPLAALLTAQAPPAATGDKEEVQAYVTQTKKVIDDYLAFVPKDDDATASDPALGTGAESGKDIHTRLTAADGPLKRLVQILLAANDFPGGVLDTPYAISNAKFSSLLADSQDTDTLYGADPADAAARALPQLKQVLADARDEVSLFASELRARAASIDAYLVANDPNYKRVQSAIRRQGVVLPPSALVAGVYARVDARQGVWKAPANEGLSGVIAPVVMVDNNDQGRLNVDAATGKSINVLRAFAGRGTLVWGARTLLGNDDNWRYVNVRRLFIFLEESIEKSMNAYVFEPNTANTWVKCQTAIENFLFTIWRQGGLAGAKPTDAYKVAIGLGVTMTADDVNAGRLIVDVMVAPSRPAEFIILRFSQLVQVS